MKTTIHAMAQRDARAPLEAITLPQLDAPDGHDVDIAVMHCSVCHSDVHLLDGDWGVQGAFRLPLFLAPLLRTEA